MIEEYKESPEYNKIIKEMEDIVYKKLFPLYEKLEQKFPTKDMTYSFKRRSTKLGIEVRCTQLEWVCAKHAAIALTHRRPHNESN